MTAAPADRPSLHRYPTGRPGAAPRIRLLAPGDTTLYLTQVAQVGGTGHAG